MIESFNLLNVFICRLCIYYLKIYHDYHYYNFIYIFNLNFELSTHFSNGSERDTQNTRMLPAAGQMTNMILLFTQPTKNGNLPVRYACAIIILTHIALNSLREVLQLYQQRWHYLLDPINLVSWLLYISSIMMILPVFVDQLNGLQLSCASITVFLSWFNLLLYLQRWVSLLHIFWLLKN